MCARRGSGGTDGFFGGSGGTCAFSGGSLRGAEWSAAAAASLAWRVRGAGTMTRLGSADTGAVWTRCGTKRGVAALKSALGLQGGSAAESRRGGSGGTALRGGSGGVDFAGGGGGGREDFRLCGGGGGGGGGFAMAWRGDCWFSSSRRARTEGTAEQSTSDFMAYVEDYDRSRSDGFVSIKSTLNAAKTEYNVEPVIAYRKMAANELLNEFLIMDRDIIYVTFERCARAHDQ